MEASCSRHIVHDAWHVTYQKNYKSHIYGLKRTSQATNRTGRGKVCADVRYNSTRAWKSKQAPERWESEPAVWESKPVKGAICQSGSILCLHFSDEWRLAPDENQIFNCRAEAASLIWIGICMGGGEMFRGGFFGWGLEGGKGRWREDFFSVSILVSYPPNPNLSPQKPVFCVFNPQQLHTKRSEPQPPLFLANAKQPRVPATEPNAPNPNPSPSPPSCLLSPPSSDTSAAS